MDTAVFQNVMPKQVPRPGLAVAVEYGNRMQFAPCSTTMRAHVAKQLEDFEFRLFEATEVNWDLPWQPRAFYCLFVWLRPVSDSMILQRLGVLTPDGHAAMKTAYNRWVGRSMDRENS